MIYPTHAWVQVFGLPPPPQPPAQQQQHEEEPQGDLGVNAFAGDVSSWFADGLPTSSIFAGPDPILSFR
jgi:hypothetical protein